MKNQGSRFRKDILSGGGEQELYLAVAVQIIISFINLLLFYDILREILSSIKIAFGVAFLYAVSPAVIGWDKIILVESLALSGTVFFIWLLVKYLKKPDMMCGIWVNLLLLFLVFLRPTFIVNYCIIVAFWLIRFFMYPAERRILRKELFAALMVGLLIVGYCVRFNQQYGIFTLSATKTQQDCITIALHSLWKGLEDPKGDSLDIIQTMRENNSPENENGCISAAAAVLGNYDLPQISKFNREVRKTKNFWIQKCKTFFFLSDIDLSNNVWYGTNIYTADFLYHEDEIPIYSVRNSVYIRKFVNIWRKMLPTVRFIHIYFIGLIELAIIVYGLKKGKDVWIHLVRTSGFIWD